MHTIWSDRDDDEDDIGTYEELDVFDKLAGRKGTVGGVRMRQQI